MKKLVIPIAVIVLALMGVAATFTSPSGGGSLDALTDTDLASPSDGQSLVYHGDSGNWTNKAGGAASAGGSDTQIQYNNGGSLGGAPNLVWVDADDELIATNGALLVVKGSSDELSIGQNLIKMVNNEDLGLGANNTTFWKVDNLGPFNPNVKNVYDVGTTTLRVGTNYSVGFDGTNYFVGEAASAPTELAGHALIYALDDGGVTKLYYKQDDGTQVGPLGAGGGLSAGTNANGTMLIDIDDAVSIALPAQGVYTNITSYSESISTGITEGLVDGVFTNTTAGYYFMAASIGFDSSAAQEFQFSFATNTSAATFGNYTTNDTKYSTIRKIGTGGDIGSVSIAGVTWLAANSTIQVIARNLDATTALRVSNMTFTVMNVMSGTNAVGGSTTAAGGDGHIQFNIDNAFTAENNLKWDNTNNILSIGLGDTYPGNLSDLLEIGGASSIGLRIGSSGGDTNRVYDKGFGTITDSPLELYQNNAVRWTITNTHLVPNVDGSYDIGTTDRRVGTVYATNITVEGGGSTAGSISLSEDDGNQSYTITADSTLAANKTITLTDDGMELDDIIVNNTVQLTAVKYNIWTNYVQTVSNFVFTFTTNRYELKNQTNVVFTNITEMATAEGSDMAVHIENTTGVTMGLVWPAYGAQHGYFFHTNANNDILNTTTLASGEHGVVSLTAFGTNIFGTFTVWP